MSAFSSSEFLSQTDDGPSKDNSVMGNESNVEDMIRYVGSAPVHGRIVFRK
jgi:hypothetical protein